MAAKYFSVDGCEAIKAAFDILDKTEAKKVVRQALRPAFKPMLDRVKADTPKDSGDLKRSLKLRASKKSTVRIGVIIGTSAKNSLFTGKTFYAGFLEFGTKRIRARNFIRNAFEAKAEGCKEDAIKRIYDGIGDAVNKHAVKNRAFKRK